MIFEEYENENIENNEPDTEYNSENNENSRPCTYVYTADYEIACAEDLVSISTENESNENDNESAEETENREIEASPSPSPSPTPDASATPDPQLELLNTWRSEYNAQTIVINKFNEDMQNLISDIHSYIDLFIGLWFIAWIFAQLNSWRRNNK